MLRRRVAACGFTACCTFHSTSNISTSHLCKSSLPREDVDLAIANMRSTCMDGLCLLDSRPCCRGHHVPQRLRVLLAAATFARFEWYMNNAHTACSSIALCLTCHEPNASGQILARLPGRSPISEKGWVEHCASAVTAGRLGKATGVVCELLKVKRHLFMKRTVFTL